MITAAGARAQATAPGEPAPVPPPAPKPLWEAGVIGLGLSQQAYPGSDQQVARALALPYLIYRGPLLRAEQGAVGLRAVKTPTVEVDVGFAAALGSRSGDIEARRGMADLGTLVEAGPRLKWTPGGRHGQHWRVEVPLRAVFDLDEGLAWRGWVLAPELVFERRAGAWAQQIGVGPVFGGRRLNEMYYRVPAAQATPDRPAYRAQAGLLAWRLQGSVSRSLGPDWRLFAFVRVDSVAGAANAGSPLVRRRTGASAGIGLAYTWMRSSRPAVQ